MRKPIESYEEIEAGDHLVGTSWFRNVHFRYRRGCVPGVHGYRHGCYFRHPRTFAILREIAKYTAPVSWVDEVVAEEPPPRQKARNTPTLYDDNSVEVIKNWKRQRKTRWRS